MACFENGRLALIIRKDATTASRAESGPDYRFVYMDQEGYERNSPQTFAALAASFGEYQED